MAKQFYIQVTFAVGSQTSKSCTISSLVHVALLLPLVKLTGGQLAEPWWVNSIVRHPVLIPYTNLGNKRLNKIYLDTTFAVASNIFRTFPSKAEGIAELLRKVEEYPGDTIFYLRAWTFGYEEAWVALSSALNAKVFEILIQP